MIPPWTSNGTLPVGIHAATWSEVETRFGWNARRRLQISGLAALVGHLSAIGCQRLWVDGSFVTTKEHPGDYDVVWDPDGANLEELDPVLRDLQPPRRAQHVKFGGDILPNVVEQDSGTPFLDFFQTERETGAAKGIIELNIEGGAK